MRDGSLQLPRGAINSQEIDLFIRDLARNVHRDSFDTLPIPFQAMATDLTTGEPVTFRSGDLATALRASMAVPGLFDPVPYGDSLLVDGGLARQLPIQNLKNQCADILIVVDVGTPSLKPGAIRSVLDVVAQATNIGVQQNVRQQMRYLDKRDIFIRPDLGNYTSASFSASPQLAELVKLLGERCKTLKEIAQSCRYFYEEFAEFDADAAKKHLRPVARQPLEVVRDKLAAISDWTAENVHHAIQATADELEVGMGKVGMPLRVAVTGAGQSPALDVTVHAIGKSRSVDRINKALAFIAEREGQAS